MSMFQCQVCGCAENTARGVGVYYIQPGIFDWSYAPERKGLKVCSGCGPLTYRDGTPTRHGGKWHGKSKRTFYPLGMFVTGPDGNLQHKTAGKVDLSRYVISDDTIARSKENNTNPTQQWLLEMMEQCQQSPVEFEREIFNVWTETE